MTATPHFLFAAMAKLHHTAASANLRQNSSVSPKEASVSPLVQQQQSDLCIQKPCKESESSSPKCKSSPRFVDSVALRAEVFSPYCRMVTSGNYSTTSTHISDTMNNVKRRRKPDGNLFLSFR
uniref:Uncharacterized protein n=1 Tax=Setaria digitata TaxID=48799 RepID=A0A915Q519_9BILA